MLCDLDHLGLATHFINVLHVKTHAHRFQIEVAYKSLAEPLLAFRPVSLYNYRLHKI